MSAHPPAPIETRLADFGRRQQVGNLEIRLRRIGHQHERIVRLAQEAGVLAVRQVAAGAAHRLGQNDVGWQIGSPPLQIADHAAGMRRIDAAGEQPAGLHHLMACIVNCCRGVVARSDERELIGLLGH